MGVVQTKGGPPAPPMTCRYPPEHADAQGNIGNIWRVFEHMEGIRGHWGYLNTQGTSEPMGNGKHVTCHSEWHDKSATVGSSHWYKNWPYLKKDMTQQIVTCWLCSEERASCWMSGGKDTDVWTVSQHNPKKWKVWVRQRSDLETFICNPSLTNKEHKNEWALLPACLE